MKVESFSVQSPMLFDKLLDVCNEFQQSFYFQLAGVDNLSQNPQGEADWHVLVVWRGPSCLVGCRLLQC